MNIAGTKLSFLLEITETLFGEPTRDVMRSVIFYEKAPFHFIAEQSRLSISDFKTVILSLYSHGIISVGPKNSLSCNPLPLLIMSSPSILLEQISSLTTKNDHLSKVVSFFLKFGIVDIHSSIIKSHFGSSSSFEAAVNELFDMRFLVKGISTSIPLSTFKIISLENRMKNIRLSKSRSTAQLKENEQDQKEENEIPNDCFALDWKFITEHLRWKYVIEFVSKAVAYPNLPLIEEIFQQCQAANYHLFKPLIDLEEESLKKETIIWPKFSIAKILSKFENLEPSDFYKLMDDLCVFDFLALADNSDSFSVKTPRAIRKLQLLYIESFLEQNFSSVHKRIFNALRNLNVGDILQVEEIALASSKDARCAMYTIAQMGLGFIQAIPKSNERNIAYMNFVWRYDEGSCILNFTTIISENCRRIWGKIRSLISKRESLEKADSGDMKSSLEQQKCDKQLAGFQAYYNHLCRAYVLFSEM